MKKILLFLFCAPPLFAQTPTGGPLRVTGTGQIYSPVTASQFASANGLAAGGTVTSITAGTGLTGGTITSIGTIGLGTTLAALNTGNPFIAGTNVTFSGTWPNITISASGSGGGGTVTSFSSGNLSPLFTTSVATATSTPALTYALSNAGANTILGNATGSSGAPSYTAVSSYQGTTSTTFAAGNDTRFPASVTGLRKGAGAGSADTAAVAGIDYVAPTGSGATLTGLTGNAVESISAASSTTLSSLGRISSDTLTLGAGSGAYTVNRSLSDTNAQAGDEYLINVTWPTSTNPTLNIYDTSTSGTLLVGPLLGTTPGGSSTLQLIFNGTHWVHYSKGEVPSRNLGSGVMTALGNAVNTASGFAALTSSTNLAAYINIPANLNERQIAAMTVAPVEAQSNGTDTTANVRCMFVSPTAHGIQDIRTWWANWNSSSNAPTVGNYPYTLRASIEYPVGTFNPVFFNGSRDVVVQPGAIVSNDPVAVDIPANTAYYVRAFIQVTTGQTWTTGFIVDVGNGPNGGGGLPIVHGGYSHGTGLTDLTTSGTISDGFGYAFGPVAVTGRPADGANMPAIGLVGDSIAYSSNGNNTGYDYQVSALTKAIFNAGYAENLIAKPGTGLNEILGFRPWITLASRTCTVVISEVGINNVRGTNSPTTVSGIEAAYVQLWTEFTSRGIKVYQTTLTPNSSSTDNWATAGNQTGIQTANRAAINDWIRTVPAPLSGYIEFGGLFETSQDSNIWITNGTASYYTIDGLHPTKNACALEQSGIVLPTLP